MKNREIIEFIPREGWIKFHKRLERKRRAFAFFVDMVVFSIATYFIFFF